MKNIIIKVLCLIFILGGINFFYTYGAVPSFDNNFAKFLTDSTPDQYGRKETVFDLCISRNRTLKDNVRMLFYPNYINVHYDDKCMSSSGGLIWDIIRIVGFAVIFIFIVGSGIRFLFNSQEEDKIKTAFRSLIYIGYGSFLVFGATWLLGTVLDVENLKGTTDLVQKIQGTPDSLFFLILSFFKSLAFFIAIIMIIRYGVKTMQSMDEEEKIKNAQKGILNVIIALIFIKIIDFIFYIAQVPDFSHRAADMIVEIGKMLGYLLGALFIIYVFYAGFLMMTSQGEEEALKKTKNILMTIFLSTIVIFLFLLIIYQIFNEFV